MSGREHSMEAPQALQDSFAVSPHSSNDRKIGYRKVQKPVAYGKRWSHETMVHCSLTKIHSHCNIVQSIFRYISCDPTQFAIMSHVPTGNSDKGCVIVYKIANRVAVSFIGYWSHLLWLHQVQIWLPRAPQRNNKDILINVHEHGLSHRRAGWSRSDVDQTTVPTLG